MYVNRDTEARSRNDSYCAKTSTTYCETERVSECVCLCVCVCVLECVGVRVCVAFALYMTSPITMTMDSTSDTAAGDMFRHDETARPTPLLFRVLSFCFVFFFCPSCTILRQPRPAAPSQ